MLILADARRLPLRDGCVQCVVTSPPFWGLRDYGTAQWEGGDLRCDHKMPFADVGHIAHSTLDGGKKTNAAQIVGYRGQCGKCGAARIDNQIGLEASPDAYVASLGEVFAEVWRVLKDDGTVWLNLGDSYNNRTKVRTSSHQPALNNFVDDNWAERAARGGVRMTTNNDQIKEKDLVGIPWRVALALQADGWYLRSDIIWAKPNPMPESVTDRPTKSHEYLFLLTKSGRYYYDAAVINEKVVREWDVSNGGNLSPVGIHKANGTMRERGGDYPACTGTRNKRSVWTVATRPYGGAHFATFPEALVEPCILAGCPVGGLVLDPFIGSGTVGAVAERLGRRWVGTDLSYQELSTERTAQRGLRWDSEDDLPTQSSEAPNLTGFDDV